MLIGVVEVQVVRRRSDLSTLCQVWLGRMPIQSAVRAGRPSFDGPTALTRRMPSMFQLSPMADSVRANRRLPTHPSLAGA